MGPAPDRLNVVRNEEGGEAGKLEKVASGVARKQQPEVAVRKLPAMDGFPVRDRGLPPAEAKDDVRFGAVRGRELGKADVTRKHEIAIAELHGFTVAALKRARTRAAHKL
jgi:hypothetical protein